MRTTLFALVSAVGVWFAYAFLTTSLASVTASVIGALGR